MTETPESKESVTEVSSGSEMSIGLELILRKGWHALPSLESVLMQIRFCIIVDLARETNMLEAVKNLLDQHEIRYKVIQTKRQPRIKGIEAALDLADELGGKWYLLMLEAGLKLESAVPLLEKIDDHLDAYLIDEEGEETLTLIRLTSDIEWWWHEGRLFALNKRVTKRLLPEVRIMSLVTSEARKLELEFERTKDALTCFKSAVGYQRLGKINNAERCFQQCLALDDPLVKYFAYLRLASLSEGELGQRVSPKAASIICYYLQAYDHLPARYEAPFYLAMIFIQCNLHYLAWVIGMSAIKANDARPEEDVPEEMATGLRKWQFYDVVGAVSVTLEHRRTSRELLERALSYPDIPDEDRERIEENLRVISEETE